MTRDRIRWCVNSFSRFKSPGPDGIFPGLLQEGLEYFIEHLFSMFRACLALAYIPESWRRVKVVFIPKPGKASYCLAKSFRPISLTSFFLKSLERLVDRHFRDNSLKTFPLHARQHAYQRGKSVETALHEVVFRIEKALSHNEFALGMFMDIEGAFDNATFESMCVAAERHGLEPTLVRWVNSMLRSRKITADLNGSTHTIIANKGCPQGGVISPLLWSLVVNELLVLLNDNGIYCQGYADDVAVILVGKFKSTLFELIQEAANIVTSWCRRRGLSVNPSKTELVLFTKHRNVGNNVLPIIEGQQVSLSQQVRYLGVYLDSKLRWQTHINDKCERAIRIYWQCRRAFGKTWGLRPNYVYWLYTQIIRPLLSFAAIVWWPRIEVGVGVKPLTQIQRMALLGVTGSVKTTPTAALEIALSILPIDLWIKETAVKTLLRLKSTHMLHKNAVLGAGGHLGVWKDMNSIVSTHMAHDRKIVSYNFERAFEVKFPAREEWLDNCPTFFEAGSLKFFTDGSLMEGSAGAGVFCAEMDLKITNSLGKYCTVFQAEVFAIITAACYIKQNGIRDSIIYICSDSQAALMAIGSVEISSVLVEECSRRLSNIGRQNRVTLVWVPGHQDIVGNESADSLARDGSSTVFTGPEPVLALSMATIRRDIESFFVSQHNSRWNSLCNCRTSRATMATSHSSRTSFLLELHRNQLRSLLGVLTGHCKLNKHLYRMQLRNNPTCDLCREEEETVVHFLCSCPVLRTHRLHSFGSYFLAEDLLESLNVRDILDFIRRTGRFN